MRLANSATEPPITRVISQRQLTALFQPVIALGGPSIVGYEGLIRGPAHTSLHSPTDLFRAAQLQGLTRELERACQETVIRAFAALALPGKLFLNVNPECLLLSETQRIETLQFLHEQGLAPDRVTIELTETQPIQDYDQLRESTLQYRQLGFEIAMDDLGEGFSSLRLWSELRPDYVKLDKHFIQNINRDPVKLQFVRSIQQIADNSGTRLIAEGIETQAELMTVKDLGIAFGQGYLVATPSANPVRTIPGEVSKALTQPGITVYPHASPRVQKTVSAAKLLIPAPAVSPETSSEEVQRLFAENRDLQSIPVTKNNLPVGLISRHRITESFSQLYVRELYGRKPCERYMDTAPLLVDKAMSLQDLSHLLVTSERRYLSDGFIITDQGRYAGIGTGHDLMREITQLQIAAARYANPLTQLPGNVPIHEHIDRLLGEDVPFAACYCDLDHFKPFNDRYGYRKGDEIIQITSQLLSQAIDPDRDFLGHVGGDDFVVLFQSDDWETRCRAILTGFDQAVAPYFSEADRLRGGYVTEDRRGQEVFHSLTRISIGAVPVQPGCFASHHEIASAITEAKKMAKKTGGILFIDRRRHAGIHPEKIAVARQRRTMG